MKKRKKFQFGVKRQVTKVTPNDTCSNIQESLTDFQVEFRYCVHKLYRHLLAYLFAPVDTHFDESSNSGQDKKAAGLS